MNNSFSDRKMNSELMWKCTQGEDPFPWSALLLVLGCYEVNYYRVLWLN